MTYGFEDGTEGMGLCLVELDKLAEIEKQTLILKEQVTNSNNQSLARSKEQANLIAQQIANEKRQREAQALINLGTIILGEGTPKEKSSSCMYNPATQAMQTCIHVTATGKCAHYTTRC